MRSREREGETERGTEGGRCALLSLCVLLMGDQGKGWRGAVLRLEADQDRASLRN